MFSKRLRLKGVRPPSFFIPPGPKFRMGTPRVISLGGVFQLIRYVTPPMNFFLLPKEHLEKETSWENLTALLSNL